MSDRAEGDSIFNCSTTVCFQRELADEETTIEGELCTSLFKCRRAESFVGRIYFLDTGLLFSSQMLRLYLPFESLSKTIVVLARDLEYYSGSPALREAKGRPVSLGIHINTIEPYYKIGDTSKLKA